jgi:hypothetical protein
MNAKMPRRQGKEAGRRAEMVRSFFGIMAGVVCGCQSSAPPPQRPVNSPAAQNQSLTADQAVNSDVSAMRLDDINGALLLYYRTNQSMPTSLNDLLAVPGFGADLNLVSPSGQPYVYVPAGLTALGTPKLLIVYDPAETPQGKRWCILMARPQPGAALSAEVVDMPEVVFQSFLASEP